MLYILREKVLPRLYTVFILTYKILYKLFLINKFKRILIWIFWEFSGFRWVFRIIFPYNETELERHKKSGIRPPTRFNIVIIIPTFLGAYLALFGLASQRYENRIDLIELRLNTILSKSGQKEFKQISHRIAEVQSLSCPIKPTIPSNFEYFWRELLSPWKSLFYEPVQYDTGIDLLKKAVEDNKENMSNAILSGADLSGANLWKADLDEADLSGADLIGADLLGANLWKADLSGADLIGAYLDEADLSGADLSGADLSGADLSEADLSEAIFAYSSQDNEGAAYDQLSVVKSLYGTKGINKNVLDRLKKNAPELF